MNLSAPFLEPTWGRTFRIWWAWFWRWVTLGLGLSFVLNVPLTGIALMLGGTREIQSFVSQIGAYVTTMAAQAYTFWGLFEKQFGGFEMRLQEPGVSDSASSAPSYIAPDFSQALRIWWSWFWRQFLISTPLGVAILIALNAFTPTEALPNWVWLVAALLAGFIVGWHVLRRLTRPSSVKPPWE